MAKEEIEHIRRERPTASAAALAAQRGLGNWTGTFRYGSQRRSTAPESARRSRSPTWASSCDCAVT